MSPNQRTYLKFLIVFLILGGTGLAATLYLLLEERAPLPFQNVYTIKAQFSAADGVISGLGQPVNVVGVKVGQVTGSRLQNGNALVTMEIQRGQLPHLYQNATAVIEPITPLDDMEINLEPGGAPAPPLTAGSTIQVGQTTSPVQLSDLLSALDGDTRDYLSSLIASLGQGVGDNATGLRSMLQAMGPTAQQAGEITGALAKRRTSLAQLIHNLAIVTNAASRDHQLSALVAAGNDTLQSLAREDQPLEQGLAELPATLSEAKSTLVDLEPFSEKLGPTVSALLPAVERLPATLDALRPFAVEGTSALSKQLRPLVTAAQPLVTKLEPAVTSLTSTTPGLTQAFQVVTYAANELAYNPQTKNDQGALFWLAWAFHNFNSVISVGDAHGGIGRAQVLLNCDGAQDLTEFQHALGVFGLCPQ